MRLIELQQQYQAAGDHESMALVAQYAAGGVDLSAFLEAEQKQRRKKRTFSLTLYFVLEHN